MDGVFDIDDIDLERSVALAARSTRSMMNAAFLTHILTRLFLYAQSASFSPESHTSHIVATRSRAPNGATSSKIQKAAIDK